MAEDIFSRVSELGGLLVVAMITPLPAACSQANGVRAGGKGRAVAAVAQQAKDRKTEEENAQRSEDVQVLRQLVNAVKTRILPV